MKELNRNETEPPREEELDISIGCVVTLDEKHMQTGTTIITQALEIIVNIDLIDGVVGIGGLYKDEEGREYTMWKASGTVPLSAIVSSKPKYSLEEVEDFKQYGLEILRSSH